MSFFDYGKDGDALLFGNSDYNNITRTTVFCGSAGLFAKKVAEKHEKIAVFCSEGDFVLARKLRGEFLKFKKSATIFTIFEEVEEKHLSFIAENCDLIVAIGEEPIIKKVKTLAKNAEKKVLAVYTGPKMTGAFSKPYADYILIDEEFYVSSKKQLVVEAFGEVVSSFIDVVDYKVAAAKNAVKYDKTAVAFLIEAINYALRCQKFSSENKALAFASLKISFLKEYTDIFKFSASKIVAEHLPEDAPYGERKLRAFKALAPIYKLYLSTLDEDLFSIPDAVRASKEIADFYKEDEFEVVEKLPPMPSESDLKANARLLSVIKYPLLKDLDVALSKFGYIDELYGCLYSGKKKLSSIAPKEMKKALKTSAYLSENNLLALLKDDGFADFI